MNVFIIWRGGYYVYVAMKRRLCLNRPLLNLYNKDGEIVTCNLEDTVMFDLHVNCKFNIRKKPNFLRNEIFAIKEKGVNAYSIYIPMDEVGLTFVEEKINKTMDGLYISTTNVYSIKANDLRFYSNSCNFGKFKECEGRIYFNSFKGYEETELNKKVTALSNEIYDSCNVRIDYYQLASILKKYSIVKK